MCTRRVLVDLVLKRMESSCPTVSPCTLIPGDGVGPELTNSVEMIFNALHVPVVFEKHKISGLDYNEADFKNSIKAIEKNQVALLGVIGSMVGPAEHLTSININLRKELDVYANVVHAKSLPGITTRHKNIDIYIMREHTEGEYSALEQETVKGVVECLKITTRQKSARIARFAFDFAIKHRLNKVTVMHKANIIKMGDGLFLNTCKKVAKSYPMIKYESMIIDNSTMQLVSRPDQFQVVLMQNLYGSIVDNICSGLTGGAGITPGAVYSKHLAIFQPGARHTFKDATDKNIANPVAMILSSTQMLHHINLHKYANVIDDAVMKVLKENKIRTSDIGGTASTTEFTEEIIKNLTSTN